MANLPGLSPLLYFTFTILVSIHSTAGNSKILNENPQHPLQVNPTQNKLEGPNPLKDSYFSIQPTTATEDRNSIRQLLDNLRKRIDSRVGNESTQYYFTSDNTNVNGTFYVTFYIQEKLDGSDREEFAKYQLMDANTLDLSLSGNLVAYSLYQENKSQIVEFRNISSGQDLPDSIRVDSTTERLTIFRLAGDVGLYYIKEIYLPEKSHEWKSFCQILYHVIGTEQREDILISQIQLDSLAMRPYFTVDKEYVYFMSKGKGREFYVLPLVTGPALHGGDSKVYRLTFKPQNHSYQYIKNEGTTFYFRVSPNSSNQNNSEVMKVDIIEAITSPRIESHYHRDSGVQIQNEADNLDTDHDVHVSWWPLPKVDHSDLPGYAKGSYKTHPNPNPALDTSSSQQILNEYWR